MRRLAMLSATALMLPILLAGFVGMAQAQAQQSRGTASEGDLAKQLANPLAHLVSVPLQNNFDFGSHPSSDGQWTLDVQPVIPFDLSPEWNLITRTIVPLQYRDAPSPRGDTFGLSDITESMFFSPVGSGLLWGVGPIVKIPTATGNTAGDGKLSMGPTAIAVEQQGAWTYGILASQLWSVVGDGDRSDVNVTSLQPFLVRHWDGGFSLTLNTETAYDWSEGQATVPINLLASQVFKVGQQPMNFQAGLRYFAERPEGGPDWGFRLALTFIFPK